MMLNNKTRCCFRLQTTITTDAAVAMIVAALLPAATLVFNLLHAIYTGVTQHFAIG